MTDLPAKTKDRSPLPDWLPHIVLLPGILSVLAHVSLLLVFAFVLRICSNHGPVGFSSEEMRDVGIVVKETGNVPDAAIPGEPRDGDLSETSADTTEMNDPSTPTQATSGQTPIETLLPQRDASPLIGPGVNLPISSGVVDPRQPVKSGGGQRAAATGTPGGRPGTAFMGTQDTGSKVIFVIDASGSMTSHNSMQVAKASLVSSLQALNENQQFLIIFYDDKPSVLTLKDQQKPQLYAATEIHKMLARQKIAGIQPGTGTQHVPALEMALRLKPDVIFFLTDAQEPPIYENELESLRKLNGQKTRVHSIEFGVGPETAEVNAPRNFLRKLSRQNGGTYRYFDVTKFK